MKSSKNNLLIFATLLLFLIVIPTVTKAISPLINPNECSGHLCVPKDARYCTLCDGLKVVQGGMTNLVELGIAVAVLIITYGAILIMVGGAMPAKIQEGKKAITAAVVGVALMLMAWIIVNQVFFLFVNKSITNKPWNQIECPKEEQLECIIGGGTPITSGGTSTTGGATTTPGTGSCANEGRSSNLTNSPGLQQVLNCVTAKFSSSDLGQITTFGGTHSKNSCHCGGRTCTDGAHAVDFGNEANSSRIIAAMAECSNATGNTYLCRCENEGGGTVPCPGGNHIHCNVNNSACGCN